MVYLTCWMMFNTTLKLNELENACGFPYRKEVYHYSHRKGERHFMPLNVSEYIESYLFFRREGRKKQSGAHLKELLSSLNIKAVGKGCWFYDHEPAIVLEGPSCLLLGLKDIINQLHLPIQVATLALKDMLPKTIQVVSQKEKEVVVGTLESIKASSKYSVKVCDQEYRKDLEGVLEKIHGNMIDAHSFVDEETLDLVIASGGCVVDTSIDGTFLDRFVSPEDAYSTIQGRVLKYKVYPVRTEKDLQTLFDMRLITDGDVVYICPQTYDEKLVRQAVSQMSSANTFQVRAKVTPQHGNYPEFLRDVEYVLDGSVLTPSWEHSFSKENVLAEYSLSETGNRPVMRFPPGGLKSVNDVLSSNLFTIPGNLKTEVFAQKRVIRLDSEVTHSNLAHLIRANSAINALSNPVPVELSYKLQELIVKLTGFEPPSLLTEDLI